MPVPCSRDRSHYKASRVPRHKISRTFVYLVTALNEGTQGISHTVRQPGH